jgi:SAM-dependent methyltransferase
MSQNENNHIEYFIEKDTLKKIKSLFESFKHGQEYEVSFKSNDKQIISYDIYEKILKVLSHLHKQDQKKYSLSTETSLDVIHSLNETTNHRITIKDLTNINRYLSILHNRKSHVVFNVLLSVLQDKHKSDEHKYIHFMKKIKEKQNIVDVDNLNLRFRLSDEIQLTGDSLKTIPVLNYKDLSKIVLRYKQRISFTFIDDDYVTAKIDITNVKTNKYMNKIENSNSLYEIEIDVTSKKDIKNKKYIMDDMFKFMNLITKIIQQSNFIIDNTTSNAVIEEYKQILDVNKSKNNLDARQPVTLEIQYATEVIPNKYSVTDKADGNRSFLMIYKSKVYFISTILKVTYTGIELKTNKYDQSILDGELIFLNRKNRFLFMIFDCLCIGSKDVRSEQDHMIRLKYADEIVSKCFVFEHQKGYTFKEYNDKFNMDDICNENIIQIQNMTENLNHDLELHKQYPLIRRKIFLPVYGIHNREIFTYASLLWNQISLNKNVKTPYMLDGLIFHPLQQSYVSKKTLSKLSEYKWKPPESNSIDFYITFEKNPVTDTVTKVYNNSDEDKEKNKPYVICYLHVGQQINDREEPVLFRENDNKHLTYIYLQDDEPRDIDGNIIQDKTVVEFYYNDHSDIHENARWIPIRTRHDKTANVKLFKKGYGNYIDTANNTWKSISNPILMSDFDKLSRDNTYDNHIKFLRSRIDHSIIKDEFKNTLYYRNKDATREAFNKFHNWVKDLIIWNHITPEYFEGIRLHVLDIACGRGGDLMKFYHAKVKSYVGIDIDSQNLLSTTDGALSRYKTFSRKYPDFPKVTLIHADAGALLTEDDQTKALKVSNQDNLEMFKKVFGNNNTKFDCMNCQFAVHYFLENNTRFDNFCQNVRTFLRPNGFLLLTTFDARKVLEAFGDSDKISGHETDDTGNKKLLFEIVKKFKTVDLKNPIGTGYPIDVYNSWITTEGNYITEYLVDPQYFIPEIESKAQLQLLDTGLFQDLYETHREFMTNVRHKESKEETKRFLADVAKYYEDTYKNKEFLKQTNLNRYYVFRKL